MGIEVRKASLTTVIWFLSVGTVQLCGTCQADIHLTIFGDGNTGSTWNLSGSGLSNESTDYVNFVFDNEIFTGTLSSGVGTLEIDGQPLLGFGPAAGTDFVFAFESALPAGTDLSTAQGHLVAQNDVFGTGFGLPPNTSFVSREDRFFGVLTISTVPEPTLGVVAYFFLAAVTVAGRRRF